MELIHTNPDWFNDALNKEHHSKFVEVNGAKIEYMECRNLINLDKKLHNKPFKLFISYYLNKVRLIDNF